MVWYRTYLEPDRRTRGRGDLEGVVIVTLSIDLYVDYGVQAKVFGADYILLAVVPMYVAVG
jgi:hypothetical protein